MIDLHSHILPGVDDGARDLAESVAIARAAAADGIRVLAATPHVRDDFPTSAETMARLVREVQAAVDAEGTNIRVVPGGEVAFEELDRRDLEELRTYGLAGNPRYLIVEPPRHGWPLGFGDAVFRLRTAGITPVIAHPERCVAVQRDPERLGVLVRAGALAQLTAASLDGRLGRTAQACAGQLLDLELVHMLVSDAHSPDLRAVGLSAARSAVGGEELGRWLTEDIPGAIVASERLPARPERRRSGGLLARLRGR